MEHEPNCDLAAGKIHYVEKGERPNFKCTCRKGFKTEVEVYKHVLNIGPVINPIDEVVKVVDGRICRQPHEDKWKWFPYGIDFSKPEEWQPYHENKAKRFRVPIEGGEVDIHFNNNEFDLLVNGQMVLTHKWKNEGL